ncbi:MAG: alcohol dehydrogenase catalytic domain-containing protein [Planctomycetes bacterium]|nr:alcohol dehydrogenase catalytic domain-containing protein [Planctomycetota bacterium]
MLSAQTVAPDTIKIIDTPVPAVGQGQVLVKMLAVGICASDSQVYHGKHKYAKFPLIQGHEGIGMVQETGLGVTHVKKGDRVTLQQQLSCGVCYSCRRNRHNVCQTLKGIGIMADGLFTEYFLSPAWNIIPVPDSFSLDKGMLIEPTSVGVNSARTGKLQPGEKVVIIGAGIIGNLTAQACLALGAADVLISDIAPKKLEVARQNGIRHCVDTGNQDLKEAVIKAFGEPADSVYECAGVEATVHQAIDVVKNSGKVVIVSNFKAPITLEIPAFQRREITIHSVMATVKDTSLEAIDLLHRDIIGIDGVISARFPLEKMQEAYQYIDDNPTTTMKVAIDIAST